MLSTIKGPAAEPDSASCLNKATSDSLWMSADTWPATRPSPREATLDLLHQFIYQSWLKLQLLSLHASPGVLANS